MVGATLQQRRRRFGVGALLPALAIILAILAYPMAASLWLSLHHVALAGGLLQQDFVGFANYSDLFASDTFRRAMPGIASEGVTLCLEPLSPPEADYINTCAEALALI